MKERTRISTTAASTTPSSRCCCCCCCSCWDCLISDPVGKARAVVLTAEDGLKAEALLRTLFGRMGWHRASGCRRQRSRGHHQWRLRGG